MKPIDFHDDAEDEARASALHYATIRPELGREFQAELSAALTRIQQNPRQYAIVLRSIRLAPLHRFPYAVVYEELSDRIWVAAVAPQHRRPRYWRGRRPN